MPPTIATPARKIGRYEVLDELGRGAMGVVYRARDTQIGRIVALKMILTSTAACGDVELYKQRFHREAQAAGRLSHPGIVTIHDIAEDETGQPYMVMEFVEGQPLDGYLLSQKKGRPEGRLYKEALDIGVQLARALAYAHQHGVVHRDVKPANLLVTADGRVKIADFGIAKLAGTELTQEGTSLGTPSYMSPEQFRGAAVDARSDQFSLGAVLFWMCTGRKPFDGDSVTTISFQIVFEALPSAAELTPGLPRELDAVLARTMAKKPEERYATCNELAEDLEALRAGRPVKAPAAATGAAKRRTPAGAAAGSASPYNTDSDETLPITAPSGFERARASAAATVVAMPERRRVRGWVVAAAASLLIAAASGIYWVRGSGAGGRPAAAVATPMAPTVAAAAEAHGAAAQPSAQAEAVVPVGGATGGAQPARAAETPSTAGAKASAAAAPVPAPSSTLRVACKHNFQSATLEVFVDNQLLFKTPLRGREHNYGLMKVYDGTFETERSIPAGAHTVRAWVTSTREGYDEQAAVGGSFSEGKSRTLEIEFGKGSATGVIGRKLDLNLR